jgi:hypothetical protein
MIHFKNGFKIFQQFIGFSDIESPLTFFKKQIKILFVNTISLWDNPR